MASAHLNHWGSHPAVTEQKPLLQRNSAIFATAWSMLVRRLPATPLANHESWPKPTKTRTVQLQRTIARRPRWPARPTSPCHLPLRPRDRGSPCVCAQPSPFLLDAPLLATPLLWRGETIVVSMANCAPPWSGRPSATTSSRNPSRFSKFARSMSRTKTFVRTRAPASPTPTPFAPTPLLSRKLHGGGQGRQEDGHTGNCGQTGGEATGSGEEGECGRVASRTWKLGL